ncbi:hypothetical protein [Streptomyces meridianus]|uniref:Uncharacterized protein n=1 Tax=Streptomyces meridianus TaxID=2938945 RepID=A0ABT0X569_9ACTN|nr:hypothetical protein [Streptomyces meridianus]MCM2577686.1 hypothetical protein [Streptomyces meridianus]
MWFDFAEGRLWFHTPLRSPNPFLNAIEQGREIAAMISTFDPPEDIRQVRTTGPGRLEPTDPDRVRAIYRRYVADWDTTWEGQPSPIRGLQGQAEYRWSEGTGETPGP